MSKTNRVKLTIDENPDRREEDILVLNDKELIDLIVDELNLTAGQINELFDNKWVEFERGTLELLPTISPRRK